MLGGYRYDPKAGVDGKCGGGASRAMRMSLPLLTLGGTETQDVTRRLKPPVDARLCEGVVRSVWKRP